MTPEVIEKDFLIELAKSVDIMDTCGIHKSDLKIIFELTVTEFHRVHNHISNKIGTSGDKPSKEFKLNFSGVEVLFKNIS